MVLNNQTNIDLRDMLKSKLMVMLDLVAPLDTQTGDRVTTAINLAEQYIFDAVNVSVFEREIVDEVKEPPVFYLDKVPAKRLISFIDKDDNEIVIDSNTPQYFKLARNKISVKRSDSYLPSNQIEAIKYLVGIEQGDAQPLLVVLTLAKRIYSTVLLNTDITQSASVATKDGVIFIDDLPPYIKRLMDSIAHILVL